MTPGLRRALYAGTLLVACACAPSEEPVPASDATHAVIPAPARIDLGAGTFTLTAESAVSVPPGQPDLARVGRMLAELLAPALGRLMDVRESDAPVAGGIDLRLGASREALGDEGYELTVDASGARVTAHAPAGVFYAAQTLRQLLPPSVEFRAARPHAVGVPHAAITDRPRFAWRGAMLDVSRHFFGVADVKRYVDLIALYKINRLHLHLSDDQGWRIEIASWPNLTAHGGSTEVGGGPGGFYTQAEYADLVAYARDRFVTIVPEIDMPGHTNAALASYPELNCDGKAPALFTGIEVGFSTLCVGKPVTYRFIDDVVREIAAMTPGPYFHIGGDEVEKLTGEEYRRFVERVLQIVETHGKQPVGWGEIAAATLTPKTIVQHWRPKDPPRLSPGTQVILSPAHLAYLDMKYDERTPIGLNWAAMIDVRTAYDWEPAALIPGLAESAILGVEAPVWTETMATMADVEMMVFPRLPGIAEIAWSPAAARGWEGYRPRLRAHEPRWSALGVNASPVP